MHRRRDHGGVIFVDLRDREGLLQIVFDPDRARTSSPTPSGCAASSACASRGLVRARPAGTANDNLASGQVELLARELEILNRSETPPFHHDEVDERGAAPQVSLPRPASRRDAGACACVIAVTRAMRDYLDDNGFIDIETPMLTKATPEGARDYLVPSRTHPGQFFALPQSPQLFKQLLMMSGFDRYYQIVRCFRDEDLRAERQPEFTQLDIETSFLTRSRSSSYDGGAGAPPVQDRARRRSAEPVPAHDVTPRRCVRYGSDKPDLRIPLELVDDRRPGAGRRVQGVRRPGLESRTVASPRCACPKAARR